MARDRDVTAEEAERLVLATLNPYARTLPGLVFEDAQEHPPGFQILEGLWDPTFPGSAVIGHFGVNLATGDVWELVICHKAETKDLGKLQKTLRKQIGLRSDELRRLTVMAPCEP